MSGFHEQLLLDNRHVATPQRPQRYEYLCYETQCTVISLPRFFMWWSWRACTRSAHAWKLKQCGVSVWWMITRDIVSSPSKGVVFFGGVAFQSNLDMISIWQLISDTTTVTTSVVALSLSPPAVTVVVLLVVVVAVVMRPPARPTTQSFWWDLAHHYETNISKIFCLDLSP